MSKINKLTINGTTYELEDPSAAGTFRIEIDGSAGESSHQAEEIESALKNGSYVYAIDTTDDDSTPLVLNGVRCDYANDGIRYFATFRSATKEDGSWWEYTVDDDFKVTGKKVSFAEKDALEEIQNLLAQKGEKTLIADIVGYDPLSASHSATELAAHMDKGPVIFLGEDDFIELSSVRNAYNGDMLATFKTAADENGVWKEYTIDDSKNITVKEMSFASAEKIGDIERALDGIIAIQNELIGGDA